MSESQVHPVDPTNKKRIAVLGSTGSIGTQTLDIVAEYPDRLRVVLLTARRNWQLLAQQAKNFMPQRVVINDNEGFGRLKDALSGYPIEVVQGPDAIAEAVKMPAIDIVVTAMVGYSGLLPTISAIEAGKTIALANKETLVVAGQLITEMLKSSKSEIIPVDSEHSAIFQCLVGEDYGNINKILLTASGGPFRTLTKAQLEDVTVADALHHPNWNMGAKVTVDSASMMNKGFEMIEAKWLFNCEPKDIEIVVHPQSIVHSMVEFADGSIKAQLGVPDMHTPIRYALSYPERYRSDYPKLSLAQMANLTFEAPDYGKFPLLGFAFDAIKQGGTMPCILNAANEVAVAAFLEGKLKFTDMPKLAAFTMEHTPFSNSYDLDILVETNTQAVAIAREALKRFARP